MSREGGGGGQELELWLETKLSVPCWSCWNRDDPPWWPASCLPQVQKTRTKFDYLCEKLSAIKQHPTIPVQDRISLRVFTFNPTICPLLILLEQRWPAMVARIMSASGPKNEDKVWLSVWKVVGNQTTSDYSGSRSHLSKGLYFQSNKTKWD